MKVRHRQTQLGIRLEAPVGCDHIDGGWAVGVVAGEDELAVVEAVVVGGVGWAVDEVVPLEDVGFAGLSGDVSHGILPVQRRGERTSGEWSAEQIGTQPVLRMRVLVSVRYLFQSLEFFAQPRLCDTHSTNPAWSAPQLSRKSVCRCVTS